MSDSPPLTPADGDPARAVEALAGAARAAETGRSPSPVADASPTDWKRACAERVADLRSGLDRLILGPDVDDGLEALRETGGLQVLFPEVQALVGFGDGEWRHKDVWKHTKQVVRQAVPRLALRWAALFHDVGKVKTRSISDGGEVHFFGHAEVGARMFDRCSRRLPLFAGDPSLQAAIRFLILHHLRANQYEPDWTDSAVRRFAREIGAHLEDLLDLARADITTKRPERRTRGLEQIGELSDRIHKLAELDAVVPPLPSGVGDAMMQAFGLPPSRLVGDLKRALLTCIESGEIAPHLENEAYVRFVRDNAQRFGLAK
jgi:poly(A) polymerase